MGSIIASVTMQQKWHMLYGKHSHINNTPCITVTMSRDNTKVQGDSQ